MTYLWYWWEENKKTFRGEKLWREKFNYEDVLEWSTWPFREFIAHRYFFETRRYKKINEYVLDEVFWLIHSFELSPRVHFTNILQAVFVPISFHQKITSLSHTYRKAAWKTFVSRKSLKMFYLFSLLCILNAYLVSIGLWKMFVNIIIWINSEAQGCLKNVLGPA